MINLPEIIQQMTANAEAIRALVQVFPARDTLWKPNAETWAMKDVMEHVYNEERIDFRLKLKEILGESPHAWDYASAESCSQALEGFLSERAASIAWLQTLTTPDCEVSKPFHFGPT